MRFELAGHLSHAEAAWEAVTDTDWMNREAGSGKLLAMEIEPDATGYPEVHGALAGPLGMRLSFVEDRNHWVKGQSFVQSRSYTSGPLVRSTYEVRMALREGGAVPHLSLELEPRRALLSPVVAANLRRIQRRWDAVLEGLPAPGRELEPRVLRPITPICAHALSDWRSRVPAEIADRVERLFETARPLELQKMRAFELADRWSLEREAVVAAFLEATQHGVLELYWSVRCPRCESQTASTPHLGNLADHAECASCRIGFDADLGENVEVLFAPHPALVERIDERFCTLFPQSAPSIEASVILAPGAAWEHHLQMAPGSWRLGAGGERPDLAIAVGSDGDHALAWTPDSEGEARLAAGVVDVRLQNDGLGRVRVQLARTDTAPPPLPASYITTLPEFRREMSHQVLAPDVRISTRSVCLLFSDLTGSTAMYEEMGDAAAYALVRDHFRVLQAAVEAHRGSVVKTIGDAVMAAFDEPGHGVAAGVQMIRDFDAWVDTQGLARPPRLKVGLHIGPALVVHTNASGLDYFGQTVNIAARTQGVASGGQLLISDEAARRPTVSAELEDGGLRAEAIEVELKGVSGAVRLHRVVVGEPDSS